MLPDAIRLEDERRCMDNRSDFDERRIALLQSCMQQLNERHKHLLHLRYEKKISASKKLSSR